MSDIVNILEQAKALIDDPSHWGRGMSFNRPGTHCAAEAIKAIALPGEGRIPAYQFFNKVIRKEFNYNSITTWNDAPERTHEDVIKAFKKAITMAKSARTRAKKRRNDTCTYPDCDCGGQAGPNGTVKSKCPKIG